MAERIVSIHQPAYLPWLGYFDRIEQSDIFVFLDTVQFQKNSFQNRNKILTAQGPVWLTVPITSRGHMSGTLQEMEISRPNPWQRKHLASIKQSYGKAPYFDPIMSELNRFYETDQDRLCDLCWDMLQTQLTLFGITKEIIRSSALDGVSGNKSGLILDICQTVGATKYISGPLGDGYLDRSEFEDASIEVAFHDFSHPEYTQQHEPFQPAMASIDFLFNHGQAGTQMLFSRNGSNAESPKRVSAST